MRSILRNLLGINLLCATIFCAAVNQQDGFQLLTVRGLLGELDRVSRMISTLDPYREREAVVAHFRRGYSLMRRIPRAPRSEFSSPEELQAVTYGMRYIAFCAGAYGIGSFEEISEINAYFNNILRARWSDQ